MLKKADKKRYDLQRMEISDDFSTSKACLESTEEGLKIFSSPAPKGVGSIQDSIDMPPLQEAPKPNFIVRVGFSIALIFFQWMTLGIELLDWLFGVIFGGSSQKSLYEEFHGIALRDNRDEIRAFLKKHSQNPSAIGYLFSEFRELPELEGHFSKVLKGANICLEGDQGFFYARWKNHPESYKRVSSHQYQGDECFAIDHILFWLDPEGNTRFQFENSPLKGFLNTMRHIADYLRHRRDNEQQGVVGASPLTEEYCLKIPLSDQTRASLA